MKLAAFPTKKNGCEIVVAKGNFQDNKCPLFVIGLYLPPGMRKKLVDNYIGAICDAVNKIKLESRNHLIIIGGDINRYDLRPAFDDFLDFNEVDSPPTRNSERLDRIFLNEPPSTVFECSVVPPLESDQGIPSDHLTVTCSLSIPHKHNFHWIKYKTRDMSSSNHDKFTERFLSINWTDELDHISCPSLMTERLHELIVRITDECFPLQNRKIPSSDDTWITDQIRRAIKGRQRKYKKNKRSVAWHEAKTLTNKLIREAKQEYYKKAVDKLGKEGTTIPYKILKEIALPDRPKSWSINSLRPDLTDDQLADELAVFITSIMDKFEPLRGNPPTTLSDPFPTFQPHEISKRIRESKKSKSAVTGNILPSLANKFCDFPAIPVTRIINYAISKQMWPAPWLMETQNAIPKADGVTTFDQLRNLSCHVKDP